MAMKAEDVEVLAVVAKLNNDLGAIVLALINDPQADGSLRADRVRELAGICDDMSALLDNHADKIDRRLVVINTITSPELPAGAAGDAPPPPGRPNPHGDTGRVPPEPDTQP